MPEVYGLHENADITKDVKESMMLLDGALLTQPDIGGGGVEDDSDKMVYHLADDILLRIKPPFDMIDVSNKYPVVYMNSMNTVLRQELIRFNALTKIIESSLKNVKKAIKGLTLMSSELEEIYTSMSVGKIPKSWQKRSYPSLKPLGSYINDFYQRIEFLQSWIDNDAPMVFWLSGFFFTQSFLTGVLQNFARKHKVPIDHIDFEFEITRFEEKADDPPEYGVYVKVS